LICWWVPSIFFSPFFVFWIAIRTPDLISAAQSWPFFSVTTPSKRRFPPRPEYSELALVFWSKTQLLFTEAGEGVAPLTGLSVRANGQFFQSAFPLRLAPPQTESLFLSCFFFWRGPFLAPTTPAGSSRQLPSSFSLWQTLAVFPKDFRLYFTGLEHFSRCRRHPQLSLPPTLGSPFLRSTTRLPALKPG